ncbi:MAG: disulfide bond formation protein B, partial [Proteobacteria bacterium]|nr:disulfide bond formation protein B [Pseudomonadota bacterium]
VLIIVSAAAIILTRRAPPLTPAFLGLCTLLFLASAGVAFFHTGVEQHWWKLEDGCKVIPLTATDTAAVLAQIMATPQAHCDEIAWKLFGLSITVWNTALSLAMAMYIGVVAWLRGCGVARSIETSKPRNLETKL